MVPRSLLVIGAYKDFSIILRLVIRILSLSFRDRLRQRTRKLRSPAFCIKLTRLSTSLTRRSGSEGIAQNENCFRLVRSRYRSRSFPNFMTKGLQEIPFRNISFQYSTEPSFKVNRHICNVA